MICLGGGIGRHAGLKILWAFARAGSIPAPSTPCQGRIKIVDGNIEGV